MRGVSFDRAEIAREAYWESVWERMAAEEPDDVEDDDAPEPEDVITEADVPASERDR